MAIDGLFIHYLTKELKEKLIGAKINKVYQPHPLDIILNIRHQKNNFQLLISVNLNAPRIYFTNLSFDNPEQPHNFCLLLRKTIERGIIKDFYQVDNDRIMVIIIESFDELGDLCTYHLIFEVMGRNANLILVNDQMVIVDALRKFIPSDNERLIIPKATYVYPDKTASFNPFMLSPSELKERLFQLEGVSKLLLNELKESSNPDLIINQPVNPVIITTDKKKLFYVFDLKSIDGSRQYYPSISNLLDEYFIVESKNHNNDYDQLAKLINKEIKKLSQKLKFLNEDLEQANLHLGDKSSGLLLQSVLYQIKPNQSSIEVKDYQTNQMVTISLDPLLDPVSNMQKYFTKYKKSQKAIYHINEQLRLTSQEITYLESILADLQYAQKNELQEIKTLLQGSGYQKLVTKNNRYRHKISLLTYHLKNATIMVGRNHLQNAYLTHQVALKTDYWFHVKNAPGAHVVIRTNQLTEEIIRIGALLSTLFSPLSGSSSVEVDYTLVKYLKKVPGVKGHFVTYSNQKTIYIDPDQVILDQLIEKNK